MTTSKICDRHLTLRNCRVWVKFFTVLPLPGLVYWLTKENDVKPLGYVSQVFSFVVMLSCSALGFLFITVMQTLIQASPFKSAACEIHCTPCTVSPCCSSNMHMRMAARPLTHLGFKGLESPAQFLQSCLLTLWARCSPLSFLPGASTVWKKACPMTEQRTQLHQIERHHNPRKRQNLQRHLPAHSQQDPVMSVSNNKDIIRRTRRELLRGTEWHVSSPSWGHGSRPVGGSGPAASVVIPRGTSRRFQGSLSWLPKQASLPGQGSIRVS